MELFTDTKEQTVMGRNYNIPAGYSPEAMEMCRKFSFWQFSEIPFWELFNSL